MGLIDSILGFFVNRDIDKLQNSEEWKNIVHKINSNRIEMDNYNEQLEAYLEEYNKIVANAKKKGIKVKPDATIEEIIAITSKY
jgi:hypothetical protein